MSDISPEEFRKRLHGASSTPGPQKRCPICGSTGVRKKTPKIGRTREYDDPWACGSCTSHFEAPVKASSKEAAIQPQNEQSH